MITNEEKLCRALAQACDLIESMMLGARLLEEQGLLKVEETDETRVFRALIKEIQET